VTPASVVVGDVVRVLLAAWRFGRLFLPVHLLRPSSSWGEWTERLGKLGEMGRRTWRIYHYPFGSASYLGEESRGGGRGWKIEDGNDGFADTGTIAKSRAVQFVTKPTSAREEIQGRCAVMLELEGSWLGGPGGGVQRKEEG
jgi:hypothetical protein